MGLNHKDNMVEGKACLVPRDYQQTCKREGGDWPCMAYKLDKAEVQRNKRPLEEEYIVVGEIVVGKVAKLSGVKKDTEESDDQVDTELTIGGIWKAADQSGNKQHAGEGSDSATLSTLITGIGRDNSISCLIRCSRSDYGAIALLNHEFHTLIRSGELYRLRRLNGVAEYWVYFSCQLVDWEAFDPSRRRWMQLPRMNSNECFVFADKESLGVGTELLVFGRDLMSHAIYCYSLLTNTWSTGMSMNFPRCLFGSASLGKIAILAGGCSPQGKILSIAELYNSETGTWTTIPSMNKPRKMCSAVFMDGKFYVVGGVGAANLEPLTDGEEYDLETQTWTEIPNMSPMLISSARVNERRVETEAPPLIAVVNNELYAADYADMEVRKFDKVNRVWITVGRLPEHADSTYGWGLAFRGCGDRLIVLGGPRSSHTDIIEVNSWVPREGPPQWEMLGRKRSASFVYNCAVMGC